ncbi:TPA: hypothetical protein ACX6S7_002436 [Photobacterium damselae]
MNSATLVKKAKTQSESVNFEWTDEDIHLMRVELINDALFFLARQTSRVDKVLKDQLIRWLLSETVEPFSSEVCFCSMGMDGDETRQFLRKHVIRDFDFEKGMFS